jgi:hypothetical protein
MRQTLLAIVLSLTFTGTSEAMECWSSCYSYYRPAIHECGSQCQYPTCEASVSCRYVFETTPTGETICRVVKEQKLRYATEVSIRIDESRRKRSDWEARVIGYGHNRPSPWGPRPGR